MPPPLRALLNPNGDVLIQRWSLIVLMTALRFSGLSIEYLRLSEDPTTNSRLGKPAITHGLDFRGMLLGLDGREYTFEQGDDVPRSTVQHLAQPLAKLKHLRLDLNDKYRQDRSEMILLGTVRNGTIRTLLTGMHELQSLDLRLCFKVMTTRTYFTIIPTPDELFGEERIFGRLRRLRLADLWLEARDLCRFLGRHAETLDEVELVDINLGETCKAQSLGGRLSGGVRVPLPLMLPAMSGLGTADTYPEWEAVAKTCRGLRKLRGLAIDAPWLGVAHAVLGVFEVEELVEQGMDGRPKCLVPRPFKSLWA